MIRKVMAKNNSRTLPQYYKHKQLNYYKKTNNLNERYKIKKYKYPNIANKLYNKAEKNFKKMTA